MSEAQESTTGRGLGWRIALTLVGLVLAWLAWKAVVSVVLGLLVTGIVLLVLGLIAAVVWTVLHPQQQ